MLGDHQTTFARAFGGSSGARVALVQQLSQSVSSLPGLVTAGRLRARSTTVHPRTADSSSCALGHGQPEPLAEAFGVMTAACRCKALTIPGVFVDVI